MRSGPVARVAFIATFFAVSLFWLFIILNVIKFSLPYNSFTGMLYGKTENIFRSALPEGFAFFTRNPREFQMTLYDSNKNEIDLHNGCWKYFLGLSRYPRAYNVELGYMFNAIAGKEWHNCVSGTIECIDDNALPHYTIKNEFPDPMMRGDYYLKIDEPTPWAWAKSFKEASKDMPCKVIKLSIE